MPDKNPNTFKLFGQELELVPKTFSTGSTGYWAGGKITLDGAKYQVSVNVVKVGSKPQA